jgi:putative hydrolase of the HAD superfamily
MTTAASIIHSKKAVLFDLFHTLLSLEKAAPGLPDTPTVLGVSSSAWYECLFNNTRARLVGEIRDPVAIVADIAHGVDPTISIDRIRAATESRIARFATALANMPDASRQVLRAMKDRGKRIALCSNADALEMAAWDRCPIAPLFDVTIFSCNEGCMKPEREIYDLCLRRLGVEAEEAVFVGDGGSRELEGARAAGLTTIMVAEHIRPLWPEQIPDRARHADAVIERLAELTDYP